MNNEDTPKESEMMWCDKAKELIDICPAKSSADCPDYAMCNYERTIFPPDEPNIDYPAQGE